MVSYYDAEVTVASSVPANEEEERHMRSFGDIKVLDLSKQTPDDVAKRNTSANVVIFDGFLTEEKYAKSFHYYANGTVRALDVPQLQCLAEARNKAYAEGAPLLQIEKTLPSPEVVSALRPDRDLCTGAVQYV